ncbi:MAG: hypothetical protein JO323_08525 [Acidobacteriia bacterium]|nr:hypothetical protein [Terriglobia bacterium]
MSAAEKYGRVDSMPSQALSQAREAGQTLADKGVTHSSGPSQTPASRYATPATNHMQKSLSQGRSM